MIQRNDGDIGKDGRVDRGEGWGKWLQRVIKGCTEVGMKGAKKYQPAGFGKHHKGATEGTGVTAGTYDQAKGRQVLGGLEVIQAVVVRQNKVPALPMLHL